MNTVLEEAIEHLKAQQVKQGAPQVGLWGGKSDPDPTWQA